MSTKRCLLTNQIVVGPVGSAVSVYGHQFIIQKNGSAIAEIDEAFIEVESKSNRYKVIENDPVQQHPIPRKDLLMDIGYEIKDLFGTKDINKLYKKIRKFDKDQAILFAETRLKLNFPDSMSHSKMIGQISECIKLQLNPPKTVLEDKSK